MSGLSIWCLESVESCHQWVEHGFCVANRCPSWPNLQSLLLLCKVSCKEEYSARDGQASSISFPGHYLVLISVCILDIVSTRRVGERTGNSPACTDKYIFHIAMLQDFHEARHTCMSYRLWRCRSQLLLPDHLCSASIAFSKAHSHQASIVVCEILSVLLEWLPLPWMQYIYDVPDWTVQ